MAINRYIVILLAFLCSFAIVGCDDYNDVDYPDTKLIKGQWQLVEDGDTDNPLIYRFTTDSENTGQLLRRQCVVAMNNAVQQGPAVRQI